MVEFAKENKLDVIAANAPFRYVNIASHQGQESLMKLSEKAKQAIAPLPYDTATGKYAEKLHGMMNHVPAAKSDSSDSNSAPKVAAMPKMSYNIIQGQSLWDATMAYSVFEYLEEHPDAKVLHLNGRFHTDEYFGIVQRLIGYSTNIKLLVISGVTSVDAFPDIDFSKYSHLGDYIIFTNPN